MRLKHKPSDQEKLFYRTQLFPKMNLKMIYSIMDKRLKVLKKELKKDKNDKGIVGHDLRSKIYELEYLKEQIKSYFNETKKTTKSIKGENN